MAPNYFSCDVCKSSIGLQDPRIHCLDCPDYDLCAKCAVSGRDSGTHSVGHRTQVFKTSGGGALAPVLSSATIFYGATSASPPPLPPRHFPGTPQSTSSISTLSSVASSTYTAVGWAPFFTMDMSPTPVFVQLMTSILAYLDTGRTGHLVPEAYSRFLDDQAYVGGANTWKAGLIPRAGQITEDIADMALKRAFDLFSIEYILRPRPRNPNATVDDLTRQLQAMGTTPPASVSGGMMPLLTLKGFMDITAIEMLCDPSTEWGSMARVVRSYDLPEVQAWGELPRSVLPDQPDPRMKARVARATTVSRNQGAQALEASRVRLMLQAQGEQNALDLLDDRRYYYTYR
ncbi:hypothetical protein C8R47DRAFT_1192355 [Mycena vitilis]|nr:hypothetical protein C8R47DRAFT_1243553 [Mycena vitilis]KAJ6505681.1 hypothetical protein C8R47DRAFT_1192355 [Mycena vitilis]